MKYQKVLALIVVVAAIALSVPGCGKKNGNDPVGGGAPGQFGQNGFSVVDGGGQATILSKNTCYNVTRESDGSLQFPIATDPTQPHTISQGNLYATAYVASTVYVGGNHYTSQTSYGDTLDVYITGNDQYFSGMVHLAPATVKQIQQYLGKTQTYNTLCVDGVIFNPATINGTQLGGYKVLYVNDYPVIYL